MVSKWEEVTLGDFVDHQKGHIFKSRDYQDEGELIVRVSDFTDRSIDISSCNRIDKLRVNEFQSVRLKAFDVVIATVGSWPNNPASIVGKTVSVPKEAEGALLNQNAVRLRAVNKMEQRFLFFLLKDKAFQSYIVSTAQGSANQASITLRDIFRYSFKLPPLAVQKDIAHILGALDDKIELNRQMSETLEAMAQALFKSWFVDFDPVIDNALAVGNFIPNELFERAEQRKAIKKTDTEDTQAIRSLFPDEFEFIEEVGWIPKGWESVTLGNFAVFGNGKASPDRNIGNIPVFGSNGKIGDCAESNRENTIIIGRVGSYCGSLQYYPSKCWITDNAMSAEMQNKDHNVFLFQLLARDNLNNRRTGSGQPLLNQSILRAIKAVKPCVLAIDEYSRITNDFYRRINQINEANLNLEKLRDILLPKLMSGEIRIPDAAALVEDA